mmetsp:Transcript_2116/g.4731  ORF Transcript_2116/g.4731 Transcript_2116/m.4731 type:complete len:309 (+) Transcript_2116:59-985(+)
MSKSPVAANTMCTKLRLAAFWPSSAFALSHSGLFFLLFRLLFRGGGATFALHALHLRRAQRLKSSLLFDVQATNLAFKRIVRDILLLLRHTASGIRLTLDIRWRLTHSSAGEIKTRSHLRQLDARKSRPRFLIFDDVLAKHHHRLAPRICQRRTRNHSIDALQINAIDHASAKYIRQYILRQLQPFVRLKVIPLKQQTRLTPCHRTRAGATKLPNPLIIPHQHLHAIEQMVIKEPSNRHAVRSLFLVRPQRKAPGVSLFRKKLQRRFATALERSHARVLPRHFVRLAVFDRRNVLQDAFNHGARRGAL